MIAFSFGGAVNEWLSHWAGVAVLIRIVFKVSLSQAVFPFGRAVMVQPLATKTCYAKWERGESQIRVERLVQIAQILEIPLEELFSSINEATLVFQNSNNNFSNSTNFSLVLGNPALESEIAHLRYIIDAKNELLDARDREIESLKQTIKSLEKVISTLENQ